MRAGRKSGVEVIFLEVWTGELRELTTSSPVNPLLNCHVAIDGGDAAVADFLNDLA